MLSIALETRSTSKKSEIEPWAGVFVIYISVKRGKEGGEGQGEYSAMDWHPWEGE